MVKLSHQLSLILVDQIVCLPLKTRSLLQSYRLSFVSCNVHFASFFLFLLKFNNCLLNLELTENDYKI